MHRSEDHTLGPVKQMPSANASTMLAHLISLFHLILSYHIWHTSHPTDCKYTFFSHPHNSFSCIDYLFFSSGAFPLVSSVTIKNMVISEYSPVSVQFSGITCPRGAGTFPSHLANNDDFKHVLLFAWAEFAKTNEAHLSTPNLFWEAGKAFLRGRIIS